MLQDRKSNLAEGQPLMSSYDDEFRKGREPSAARVGADLKAARERLGWKLSAVSGHLRIRLPYLQAIEDGRVDLLPGNAYAIGFLRTYAQALGLDPDEVSRRFRAEASETTRKTELNFPAPVPERGVPAMAIVLVGALIAFGAYGVWYKVSGSSHATQAIVQAVPERLAPLAERPPASSPSSSPSSPPPLSALSALPNQTLSTPPLPGPALSSPASLPHGPTSPAFASRPTIYADPVALPSVPPGSAAAAVVPPLPAVVSAPTIVPGSDASEAVEPTPSQSVALATPAAPVPAAAPAVSESGKPDGPRMVLRAKTDAWIQVREKSGSVLISRVLRAGETWPVPDKPNLLLTTGNAGGTEVLVDGQPTASLGIDGGVRRDLPLDADAIKDGKLAGTPGSGGAVTPVSATQGGASGTTATKKP